MKHFNNTGIFFFSDELVGIETLVFLNGKDQGGLLSGTQGINCLVYFDSSSEAKGFSQLVILIGNESGYEMFIFTFSFVMIPPVFQHVGGSVVNFSWVASWFLNSVMSVQFWFLVLVALVAGCLKASLHVCTDIIRMMPTADMHLPRGSPLKPQNNHAPQIIFGLNQRTSRDDD